MKKMKNLIKKTLWAFTLFLAVGHFTSCQKMLDSKVNQMVGNYEGTRKSDKGGEIKNAKVVVTKLPNSKIQYSSDFFPTFTRSHKIIDGGSTGNDNDSLSYVNGYNVIIYCNDTESLTMQNNQGEIFYKGYKI